MKKKEERDYIMYGTYNQLLRSNSSDNKSLNDTYADIATLFNLDVSTVRHIINRMQHLNGISAKAHIMAVDAMKIKVDILNRLKKN